MYARMHVGVQMYVRRKLFGGGERYVWMDGWMDVCAYVCRYVHTAAQRHVSMYVCMFACMNVSK